MNNTTTLEDRFMGYLGAEGIPKHLLNNLENGEQGKTYIEKLARDLYQTYANAAK